MKKDTHKTPILFVKPKYPDGQREILALFPTHKERDGTIGCYARTGQHGTAHKSFMKRTKAKATEFDPLYKELENRGYNLEVRNDFYSYQDLKAEYKLGEDSGDKWGSAMGAMFSLCAELYERGDSRSIEALAEWQYSAPTCAGDVREPDDGYYDLFENAQSSALLKLGALLSRYIDRLDKAGHSY
jgi:hypothetical protein